MTRAILKFKLEKIQPKLFLKFCRPEVIPIKLNPPLSKIKFVLSQKFSVI